MMSKEEVAEIMTYCKEKGISYKSRLAEFEIQAVYRKRSLSTLGAAKYIKPYLLRGLKVDHRNQVWSIDITYIPMKNHVSDRYN